MKGRVYLPKGRTHWRVEFPCSKVSGGKIYVNLYAGKFPLVSREMGEHVLAEINAAYNRNPDGFDPTPWLRVRDTAIPKAWLIYQEQSPCKPARYDQRQNDYDQWIFPFCKGMTLNQIDEYQIREWWETVPKTYKPSTLRRIRATMRAFLNFHKITRVKMIQFPSVSVPKRTPDWLTRDEQEERLKFIPEQHMPVFRFLMAYGCRVSEAANLTRRDVDWKKGIITFRERKNDKDNTLPLLAEVEKYMAGSPVSAVLLRSTVQAVPGSCGGNPAPASILTDTKEVEKWLVGRRGDMTPQSKVADSDHGGQMVAERRTYTGQAGAGPAPTNLIYVFSTPSGQQYSRQVLYRIWADALKSGGFKMIALKNATRHSKANQLLAEGRSIAYVARWLGNTPSVVERNYGEISVETLREAYRESSMRLGGDYGHDT